MLSSLRARLWLSYAFVIAVALGVISIALFIYVAQNPLVYRQAAAKLIVVDAALIRSQAEWANLSDQALQKQIERAGNNFDVRVVVFDQKRKVMADSQLKSAEPLELPRLARLRSSAVVRDAQGNPWLFNLRQLETGRWLMVAVLRPKVPLLTILRDELFLPVVGAGLVALLLALLLAFLLSRWVADPLQNLVIASRQFPTEAWPIDARGPGEVQAVIGAFNAMTARVQASTQSQREFVANVSHELKTPLTSIQGFAQAILDGTAESPESQKQAAGVIYNEAARMHRMVLSLLDLARLDAGMATFKREPVDLNVLLQNVADKFSPQAQHAQVALSFQSTVLPVVTGDGDRLAQVFTNLVDNALKFTPQGGVISMRGEQTTSGVEITISDTGAGISPEVQAHIFDRFYQVDPARAGGAQHGAGLGLAIVREIVQAHSGKISVRSTLGQGSAFSVTLPVYPPDASTVARRKK